MAPDSSDSNRFPRATAVVVAAALALVAYGGGSLLASGVVLSIRQLGFPVGPLTVIAVSVFSIQIVAFVGVTLAYLRITDRSLREWVGVRVPNLTEWMYAAAGYVLAILAAIGAIAILLAAVSVLDIAPPEQRAAELAQIDPRVFLLMGILSILIVGPAEELLFRGVIQRSLRERFGVVAAVGLATALFAIIHLPNYSGPIESRLLATSLLFLPGLVFGLLYEYTGNVLVPGIAHGLYNATLMSLGYLSMRYGGEAWLLPLGIAGAA